MKIIVFGARGAVGRRVVAEAVSRGHDVTAVVRSADQQSGSSEGVRTLVADVANTEGVAELLNGFDLAVSAIRPPDGSEADLVSLTVSILSAAAKTGTRILIVGGAGSLRISENSPHTVLTAPGFLPDEVVPIARASFAQYEAVMTKCKADWTYLSPPAMLVPGMRTGEFRKSGDTLLFDSDGASQISIEDFSVAMLDEAEIPRHRRARFTVGY